MDAPAYALNMIGVTGMSFLVVTENNPQAQLFHLMAHTCKHLFCDLKCVHQRVAEAPCVKHGGQLCAIPPARPRIIVGSFVCKPYSAQNPNRGRADPMTPPATVRM